MSSANSPGATTGSAGERVGPALHTDREIWTATALRTAIPALLTIGLFVATVVFVVLPTFETQMMATRKEAARSLTETGVAILASYDSQVAADELTLAEAKRRAKERLRALRYGDDGKHYFWITNLRPIVIMHPYLPHIEGTDILDMPDASGRPLIYAFLDIVAGPEGGGFCHYEWQHQDRGGPRLPKISYVELYEPWGWIVGTGVYVDDIEARVAAMTRTLLWASGAILLVILGLSVFMIVQSARRESMRVTAERAVRERERTLGAILDNTVQFIGMLDVDGKVLLGNRASLEFTGARPEDVVGRPIWETPWWSHSPELQAELRDDVARVRDHAEPVHRRAHHRSPAGRVMHVDFSLSPILDDDGRVQRLVAEGRDVTAIHEATEALRRNEADLAAILDSIQDGVIALDAEGRIVRVNPVAGRLVGRDGGEVVGRAVDEVLAVTAPDGRPLADLGTRAVAGETGPPILAELTLPSGDQRTLEITTTAIRSADGANTGGVIVLRDRTDEFQLRQQLFQAQKLEAIGQLAGGVAHDFNNLLTSILGNAQLLSEHLADDGDEAAPAREIVEASGRAADLTRQLLAFSRKGKFQDAPVDVHALVDEVARLLERSIDKRITLACDLRADRPVVEGDAAQLQNALLNLGLNARDAMPDGGTITLATRNVSLASGDRRLDGPGLQPGDYLEISVRDTGVGMDEDTRRRIFEPFFTTKGPGAGTGLGLAGVYGCVGNHGGAIEVETAPGAGARFDILLPTTTRAVPDPDDDETATLQGEGRILVVDDEQAVRAFAARALARLGYEVEVCGDGGEAVAFVRDHASELDLVILDLIMPGLSGEETFARMRAVSEDLPILIASGFSQNEAVEALLRRGAAGFLAKPYLLADLSRTVDAHLRRRSEI